MKRHPYQIIMELHRSQYPRVMTGVDSVLHIKRPLSADDFRPQRWSIFQGDGMVNVFFRPPLPSMVFQWF